MKRFLGFDLSNPHYPPSRVARAIVVNLLVVMWTALVVYLAFTDPFRAWVCFISFMFSYLMSKYS